MAWLCLAEVRCLLMHLYYHMNGRSQRFPAGSGTALTGVLPVAAWHHVSSHDTQSVLESQMGKEKASKQSAGPPNTTKAAG